MKFLFVGIDISRYARSPPSRGAWIEIASEAPGWRKCKVAPLAGGVD